MAGKISIWRMPIMSIGSILSTFTCVGQHGREWTRNCCGEEKEISEYRSVFQVKELIGIFFGLFWKKSLIFKVNLDYYSFNRVEGIRIDGSEFFAHNCSTLMRRDETDGHFLFHNVYSTVHGEMVHRCPLWQYGCEFFAFRLYPRCSRIR